METNMPVMPVGMGYGGGEGRDDFFKYIILLGILNGGGLFGNNRGNVTEAISNEGNWTTTTSKLDGITQGLCNLGYQTSQGQNGIQAAVANGFSNLGYTTSQGFNGISRELCNLGTQFANCCCETNRNIDNVRYEMSKGFCDVVTSGHNNTRDLMENQNRNTQSIVDLINNNTNQALRDENSALKLQVSQQAQTQAIIENVIKHVAAICGQPK